MKETQLHQKDETVIEKQAEQKSELKLFSNAKIKKGQKVFEFNMTNHILKEAQFMDDVPTVAFKDAKRGKLKDVPKKLVIDKDCLYVVAINRKNAERKIKQKLGKLIRIKDANENH